VTSDTNGGWSNGGYYVHNNMWNWQAGGPETLYACAYNNWYVESTQPNTTSVKTYPNVHLDINNMNGAPLSNYRTITSTFAGAGPRVGIYNVAYDVWLNGVGWGGGTTEFMIWTENFNQRPLGSVIATPTFGGMAYDAWHYNDGNANVISLTAKSTMPSGSLNLKEMFDWTIARGLMPSNPTVNQIGYGVEICSTNSTKQRFTFTGFSVTMG
jgi:Glycosyl hydrolase family 12